MLENAYLWYLIRFDLRPLVSAGSGVHVGRPVSTILNGFVFDNIAVPANKFITLES